MASRMGCWLLGLSLAAWMVPACSGESDNGDSGHDAGKPCRTDENCVPPDTCQENGYCAYRPELDPENNYADGTFSLQMNREGGQVAVSGEFYNQYLYLDYNGIAVIDNNTGLLNLQLIGILANTLFNELFVELPTSVQTDTDIDLTAGSNSAELKRVVTDSEQKVRERYTLGEVVEGTIRFDQFGLVDEDPITGEIHVVFKPVAEP